MMVWKPVIARTGIGYWPGLDPTATYEFRRVGDPEVSVYRLADQSPYFDVAGLEWRKPPEPKVERDWTNLKAYRP